MTPAFFYVELLTVNPTIVIVLRAINCSQTLFQNLEVSFSLSHACPKKNQRTLALRPRHSNKSHSRMSMATVWFCACSLSQTTTRPRREQMWILQEERKIISYIRSGFLSIFFWWYWNGKGSCMHYDWIYCDNPENSIHLFFLGALCVPHPLGPTARSLFAISAGPCCLWIERTSLRPHNTFSLNM